MKDYVATVREETAGWWVIDVAGVGVTQCRHLDEATPMALDLIEAMTGDAADDIRLTYGEAASS